MPKPLIQEENTRNLERAALRGEPSYVWRAGQDRRLALIQLAAEERIQGNVLDIGCGVGAYLEKLSRAATHATGLEFDFERAVESGKRGLHTACAAGEQLPLPSGYYDLVLSHEVLEHVLDDRIAVEEISRVLRPPDAEHAAGGRLVLFVPNRGYPFETHGLYWRGRYHFGNIPLINYLPRRLRDRLAPHVRVYTKRDLTNLFADLPLRLVNKTIIFGAYDNIIARWPALGRSLRGLLQFLERTPLRIFGLSHVWVLERTE
jgi:SAM-dependent methyltransferase